MDVTETVRATASEDPLMRDTAEMLRNQGRRNLPAEDSLVLKEENS